MPLLRKLQSILRPKNIWMCTKVIIKLYVAICVIDDMIIHIKKVPEYLQPFASAVVSYMPYESLNPHTYPLSRLIFLETKNASHYDVYPCKV